MASFGGTSLSETLIGSGLSDWISGLAGNDTLNGGGLNDILDGGSGDSFVDFVTLIGVSTNRTGLLNNGNPLPVR